MNPAFLLTHWARLSQAPGAIPALRQFILTLAVRGQLTADWRAANPEAEPASELLKRIQKEKAKLIAAKKLRAEKPLPQITPAEIPFAIPKGWEWCRFGEVARAYEAGSSFKCEDREVTGKEWGVIKTSAITSGSFVERENKFLRSDAPEDTSAKVEIGDLIFCRASGSKGLAGMCAIVRECSRKLLLSDKTIRVPLMNGINQEYIALHNDSAQSKAFFNGLSTGKSTSMNNVTRGELFKKQIPLPPLAEQAAIVAQVEALRRLCDQLAAAQAERENARQHYLAAGYAGFSQADDRAASATFADLLRHTTQASDLKPLQQTVLTLAIQGKLTADWRAAHPQAEPARQLLHRIQAEKARLIAAKQLRPEKPLPKITPAEIPFAIPKTWEWCRVADLGIVIGGLTKNATKRDGHKRLLPYLRVANVYANRLELSDVQEIGVADSEVEKLLLEKDDLLVVEGNGSRDQVGRIARWDGSINPCVHQNHVIKVRLGERKVAPWALYFFLSPSGRALIEEQARTSTGLYNLSSGKVANLVIPLPPLAEQAALVARVETLLGSSRLLAAEIAHTRTHAAHLLQAVLKEAFTPAA